jgi:urea transport system substrate-binding protein
MAQPRILVVDDDTSIRSFVEMALDSVGYAVSTAGNGSEALEVTDQVQPDLILLDMRMPVMDGWTFAKKYRQQDGPHAPIVVITAATDAGQRAAEIEADGFLGKPFDLDDLLKLVSRYTSRTRE